MAKKNGTKRSRSVAAAHATEQNSSASPDWQVASGRGQQPVKKKAKRYVDGYENQPQALPSPNSKLPKMTSNTTEPAIREVIQRSSDDLSAAGAFSQVHLEYMLLYVLLLSLILVTAYCCPLELSWLKPRRCRDPPINRIAFTNTFTTVDSPHRQLSYKQPPTPDYHSGATVVSPPEKHHNHGGGAGGNVVQGPVHVDTHKKMQDSHPTEGITRTEIGRLPPPPPPPKTAHQYPKLVSQNNQDIGILGASTSVVATSGPSENQLDNQGNQGHNGRWLARGKNENQPIASIIRLS